MISIPFITSNIWEARYIERIKVEAGELVFDHQIII